MQLQQGAETMTPPLPFPRLPNKHPPLPRPQMPRALNPAGRVVVVVVVVAADALGAGEHGGMDT